MTCTTASGGNGRCRTVTLCVGATDEDADGGRCPEGKDLEGNRLFLVCCPDVLDNRPAVRGVAGNRETGTPGTTDIS